MAVDCGSKDHAAVERARQLGMDVVVLDHHRITDPPPAHAIVASAQLARGCAVPKCLAAGWPICWRQRLLMMDSTRGRSGEEPTSLLDLAMIGLVGDVSSLSGRQSGARPRRPAASAPGSATWLARALCDCAGIDARTLTSTEIAFQVSPRLNAPGRLDDPRPAYELLITRDRRQAERFAERAEQANQRRKLLQERILREIESDLTPTRAS